MGNKSMQRRTRREQRDKRGYFVGVIGLAFSFGALGYEKISPEPNFQIGISLLVLGAACLAVAVWDFIEDRRWRYTVVLIVIIGAAFTVRWAFREWDKITIVPPSVTLTATFPPENYTFTVTDHGTDKYLVLAKFRLSKPAEFFKDVVPQIPNTSLRPASESSKLADMRGELCADASGQQVFLLQIYRVTAREPREFSFNNKSQISATLTSEIGSFSGDVQPRSADPSSMEMDLAPREENLQCSSPVAFLTDNNVNIDAVKITQRKNEIPMALSGPPIVVYPDGRIKQLVSSK